MTTPSEVLELGDTSRELHGLALITHVACLGLSQEMFSNDLAAPGAEQMMAKVACVS